MITETSPILSLLFAKGLGTRTLSDLVNRLVEDDLSFADLVQLAPDDLVRDFGLRPSVAENIHAAHEQAERVAEELEKHSVQILVRGVEPYPRKLFQVLAGDAPPVLFARGCLSLLGRKAVGLCGARNASEKGIRVARDSARLLAPDDVNVVSGYAKGVDLAAHRAALEAGGVTTIVLAEGILHFRPKREVKDLLDENNYLVISEFSPRLPWAARNAMQRNKTICGLSDALIVIESGMKGGTFAAAESSLKLKRPLFVAEYAQPAESAAGNQYFIERGATALRGDRSGRPNLARVYEALGIANGREPSDSTTKEAESDVGHEGQGVSNSNGVK